MTSAITPRAFGIDEDYDDYHASNGTSRYLAYCRLNRNLFTDDGGTDEPITRDPVVFATAAWHCATGPVMSPPYIAPRVAEILSARLRRNTEDGGLLAELHLVTPRPAELRTGLIGVNGWNFERGFSGTPGFYSEPEDAYLALRPTLLTSAKLILPIDKHLLHRPTDSPELTITDVKTSVHTVTTLLEEALAPFLEALPQRSGW